MKLPLRAAELFRSARTESEHWPVDPTARPRMPKKKP